MAENGVCRSMLICRQNILITGILDAVARLKMLDQKRMV
jgi:hypothetical protein